MKIKISKEWSMNMARLEGDDEIGAGSLAAVSAPDATALRLVLMMAPSFQGGHSKVGDEVCAFLGIAFPVQMDTLAKVARAHGCDPDDLWPWWKKMREEREAVEAACAQDPEPDA